MKTHNLVDFLPNSSPSGILAEVVYILDLLNPEFDTAPIEDASRLTIRLFSGRFEGYRACNTGYHDLGHTMDTFLAMARLIHGAYADGNRITPRQTICGLIAALFHDAGYIQESDDTEGTGAKYTATHVQRSMDFIRRHASDLGLSAAEAEMCRRIVLFTDLATPVENSASVDDPAVFLGKMLGTADLVAQMADRIYLEKLLFLYHEFKEGMAGVYESETDLLRKTVSFYDLIAVRLDETLDGTDRFLTSHFKNRWHLALNPYREAISKHKSYLKHILSQKKGHPLDFLKRGNIVAKVRNTHGPLK